MIRDLFKLVWEDLNQKKLRGWLTMLGIFVGIMAVVSLISLGEGLQVAIEEEIMGASANKIFIMLKGGMMGSDKIIAEPLFEDDAQALLRIPEVVSAGGYYYTTVKIKFNDIERLVYIAVYNPDKENSIIIEEIGFEVIEGNSLSSNTFKETVIGNYIPELDFDGEKIELGDTIEINDEKIKVIGKMDRIGNQQDDSILWINPETYETIFKDKEYNSYTSLIVKIEDYNNLDYITEDIEKTLQKHRGLPRDKTDFTLMTSESITEQFNNIFSIVQIVVIGIAAISILVGGVGIMNTMYTSVLERTKEIGIMKAIGARNSHIFSIFFIESGLLGLIGGFIGTTVGITLTYSIVQFVRVVLNSNYLVFVFDWYLVIGALFFSFLIGVLSGCIPAINAAKQNPVDSLRYE